MKLNTQLINLLCSVRLLSYLFNYVTYMYINSNWTIFRDVLFSKYLKKF
jgi:hypothetical protein